MALYDSIPPEKMALKKKAAKPRVKSQKPGHPADDMRGLAEMPKLNNGKAAKPESKRQRDAASNTLDKGNKAAKVAGKGTPRDSVAQGARKAGTASPKPNGTDKKVRGQVKK